MLRHSMEAKGVTQAQLSGETRLCWPPWAAAASAVQ
jgi:hypothetical protein